MINRISAKFKSTAPLAMSVLILSLAVSAQTTPDLTSASWNGWTPVGESNLLGTYAKGSTGEVYKIYSTVFYYNGGIAGTQAGFANGNKILGIGVQRVSGTADYPILKLDFDNNSYAPATSIVAADGKTSFSTYGTLGDAVIHHPPAYPNGQPSEITIKTSPATPSISCGSFGCGTGLPGLRGIRFTPGHLKMFYDLSYMPTYYATLGAIGNQVTIAINNGTNDSVITVSTQVPGPALSCQGFLPPLNAAVAVKKNANRVLPFRMNLLDANNMPQSLITAPILVVKYSGSYSYPPGYLDELATAGQGTEGNAFTWNGSAWAFNLSTKGLASGTYTFSVLSGNAGEYTIPTNCQAIVQIQ